MHVKGAALAGRAPIYVWILGQSFLARVPIESHSEYPRSAGISNSVEW